LHVIHAFRDTKNGDTDYTQAQRESSDSVKKNVVLAFAVRHRKRFNVLLEVRDVDGGGVRHENEAKSFVVGRERVKLETSDGDPLAAEFLLQLLLDLLRRLLAVRVRLHCLVDDVDDLLLLRLRRLEALLSGLWWRRLSSTDWLLWLKSLLRR